MIGVGNIHGDADELLQKMFNIYINEEDYSEHPQINLKLGNVFKFNFQNLF